MNIFIYTANSRASVQTTGSDAVTYSAISLDWTTQDQTTHVHHAFSRVAERETDALGPHFPFPSQAGDMGTCLTSIHVSPTSPACIVYQLTV